MELAHFLMTCHGSALTLESQGGQIMDNNICGGPDNGAGISDASVPLSASAVQQVKAVVMLGNPRFVSGLPYGVGTCNAGGVSFPVT
jgi:acetylxylan esterase